jgi:hypothetical protein
MKPGKVYRRKELNEYSNSVDRELAELSFKGAVKKLSAGLYVKPEQSRFGALPPDDKELVRAFLNNNQFLLMSFNDYTSLGLGFTQLYNEILVYNRRRHGQVKLGSKKFVFKNIPEFPRKSSREFLLIDMLNNLKSLGEDSSEVLKRLKKKKDSFNMRKTSLMAKRYGKLRTKKIIKELYA